MSHVDHFAPALVVPVWCIWILIIVRRLYVNLGVIWMESVELDFSLQSSHMLSVHLISKSPENSLPNQSWLCIFQSKVVFIVWTLRWHHEVIVTDIEPEADHTNSEEQRPALEPTFWVDVIKSPIWVSFKWSCNWEAVRCVLLGQHTECVDNIWHLFAHSCEQALLEVPVLGVRDSLLKSEHFVVVFT